MKQAIERYSEHRNRKDYDDRSLLVGVDIGGTKVAALVVNQSLKVCGQSLQPTDLSSPQGTLSSIIDTIHQALEQAFASASDVAAVGLGIPGQVDRQTGTVRTAVNLNWHELPAGALLSEALGVPCLLENDVRVGALGLFRFPIVNNGQSVQNLAFITIGTGIAAGLILEGRLYRGANGMAGEIGHIVMEPDGPRCKCGNYGCLEALAAGPAIARYGQQAVADGLETQLRQYAPVTAEHVYGAAAAGDVVALAIAEKVGCYLGRGLQSVLMSYDVESIVLGGGVAGAGDIFLQPILKEWERQRQRSALAAKLLQPGIIRLAPPGYYTGAWGGIALAEQVLAGAGARG